MFAGIGKDVSRFQVGDLVCPTYLPDWRDGPIRADRGRRRLGGPTDGVLTELMCVHEEEAVRAPRHLSATEAAALPVAAATTWRTLYRRGSITPGQTLLVQGSGGISTMALQLAKAGGARTIAVLRQDCHAEAFKTLGADVVLTTGDTPEWPQDVRKATGGVGVDVALNVAGGKTLTDTVAATKLGGIVHLIGFAAGSVGELDLFEAIRHGTTFHTATAGSREDFDAFVRVAEEQCLRPAIAKVFSLDKLRDAFAYLAAGDLFGKVVVTLDF